jgi:hypothetical protein
MTIQATLPCFEEITDTPSIPEIISIYTDLWHRFDKVFSRYSTELNSLHNEELKHISDKYSYLIANPNQKTKIELHEKLVEKFCRQAEKAFAVPGSILIIDREEIFDLPFSKLDQFNPLELWNYLVKHYNTEDSKTASFKLAASAILEALELNPRRRQQNQEIRSVSGRAVLTVSSYSSWGSWNFYNEKHLSAFIDALKCIAIWSGLWTQEDDQGYNCIINTLQNAQGSDARVIGTITAWNDVHLRGFKGKVEFKIVPALAEQIQVFLATFQ